ncbi:succinylglutamate desuccinylase [Lutispora saccharofermentans]|uniref:Succinylglutamate desuccinylase n=1 Tax=Lutispora saccharofermentans TaxID=3024236 RepID=A0ABT1NJC0_9FIRM|nr:succinylglutamate desuccinylase [Lutispora saccharofermentans]MCQ1531362.1 succinylglutamate desuccinylase [Lutispora saccharofermentans]
MKKQFIMNIAVLIAVAAICILSGNDFLRMHEPDLIAVTNQNLTEVKMLSEYSPGLKGTAGDTEVYVIKGKKAGASMLILGGTHPNEIAGMLSAVTYIENARAESGTLYIIPRANNSGYTHTAPLWGMMDIVDFKLPDGSVREFRIGTRLTNPVHQWPDPNYYNGNSGRELKHEEVAEIRNLNRNHPGNEKGTLTEKVNYGIANLIRTEKIDITYDGHEAGPEFLRVNYLIAHERAMPVGSMAVMNANIEGLPFAIDLSGKTSYGLSHRALGDNTETLATLFETLNPAQGCRRGKMSKELVLGGIDQNYVDITNRGLLSSGELSAEGSSINQRTANHAVMCRELMIAFSESNPDKPIEVSGMPSYDDYINKGLENILLSINK